MKKHTTFSLSLILVLILFSCGSSENKQEASAQEKTNEVLKFEGSRLEVQKLKVGTETILAEIAAKPEDREKGLMGRTMLPENAGMMFVFEYPHKLSFWMRNTELPLSIAFIDKNMKIVDIQEMKPWDDSSYESKIQAMYALEMNKGWFEKHRIKVGDRVSFVTK